MIRFEIGRYSPRDMAALRRAVGRRYPARRAAALGLRLALGAVGVLFGIAVVFFWGTLLLSGPQAAFRPCSAVPVAIACHAGCAAFLTPALGYGWFAVRKLLRTQNWQLPLVVNLGGEEIGLELPQWADTLPYQSVEAVFRGRGCWILFMRSRRVLVLPERYMVQGNALSLETLLESRTGAVRSL